MTKVEEAIEVLQKLPKEKARIVAEAIIDIADPRSEDVQLSREQVVEIERRMSQPSPKFITLAEAKARLTRLGV